VARIVGSHFRADGKPKTGYVRESVARAEAARLGMSHYRCDFCDRFHLASADDGLEAGRAPKRRGSAKRRDSRRRGS
jgi:hypothetical protein